MANLSMALLMTGGGIALAWTGVTDPPGGLFGQVGRVLRNEPTPGAKEQPTATDLGRDAVMTAINATGGSSSGGGGDNGGVTTVGTGGTTATGIRGAVITEARRHLGKPYVLGAKGPDRFDCSGLVEYVYKRAAALTIPAPSQSQCTRGRSVSESTAQPGDLVCYGTPAWHIGIYLGGGKLLHAANPSKGVVIESVTWNGSRYYRDVLSGAGKPMVA